MKVRRSLASGPRSTMPIGRAEMRLRTLHAGDRRFPISGLIEYGTLDAVILITIPYVSIQHRGHNG
jgi:hypothetical protein